MRRHQQRMDNPLDLSGPAFLVLFLAALAGSFVLTTILRGAFRPAGSGNWRPDDPYDIALVRGGAQALLETVLARLSQLGLVAVNSHHTPPTLARKDEAPKGLRPVERGVLEAADQGVSVNEALRRLEAEVVQRESRLEAEGALMSESGFFTARIMSVTPSALVILLGVMKVFVGLSRDRPVGILLVLEVFAVLAAVHFWRTTTRTTQKASDALLDAQRDNAGLRDSMGTSALERWGAHEVALAVSLFGVAPLATSNLAPLSAVFAPSSPSSSGGSDSGSSCSSSCGSSCGGGCGGGCGGCGS